MFRLKLLTVAATQICNRNTGQQINETVLTGHLGGFRYTDSYKVGIER